MKRAEAGKDSRGFRQTGTTWGELTLGTDYLLADASNPAEARPREQDQRKQT